MTDAPKPSQSDKFQDLARQLECDEDEAKFEGQVRRIAQGRPPGSWSIVELKDGSGFYPLLTPDAYAAPERGPDFEQRAEAEKWVADQTRLSKKSA